MSAGRSETAIELACAGAINNVVLRPAVCPRCGATADSLCGDMEAQARQIAEDIDACQEQTP